MKLILAGLLSLMVTSVPLSTLYYVYTPTPHFVSQAQTTLTNPDISTVDVDGGSISSARGQQLKTQVNKSAALISWVPVVYSATSGLVMGWCITLFGAYFTVKRAQSTARRQIMHRECNSIFYGLLTLLSVNFTITLLSNSLLINMLDSMIMWNLGMIAVLGYVSTVYRRSQFFNCYATNNQCDGCTQTAAISSSGLTS
jgi:cytochrome bd-type quinol oxidase subunit 2